MNRMFRVIVLGGVALVDCGGRTAPEPPVADASTDAGADTKDDVGFGFPQLDATPPIDDATTTSDVWFPPGEANAPPPSEDH